MRGAAKVLLVHRPADELDPQMQDTRMDVFEIFDGGLPK